MGDLIASAIQGLVRIAVGAAADKQKREAEQLAELQAWFAKGADACAKLISSRDEEHGKTVAAIEEARKRIASIEEETKP